MISTRRLGTGGCRVYNAVSSRGRLCSLLPLVAIVRRIGCCPQIQRLDELAAYHTLPRETQSASPRRGYPTRESFPFERSIVSEAAVAANSN